MAQFFSVFFNEVFVLLCAVRVSLFAVAKLLSMSLSQYAQQRSYKVRKLCSYVKQARDELGR